MQAILASSSWDKTVRLWDVFEGKGSVETFQHVHDVLTVVYRPDGKQLACSTLDGQINFWDPFDGSLMYTIEGRRDIAGGRLMTDRRSAANSTSGKHFTTLCYSADGSYILAGGNSKFMCMYDVAEQVCPLLLLPQCSFCAFISCFQFPCFQFSCGACTSTSFYDTSSVLLKITMYSVKNLT